MKITICVLMAILLLSIGFMNFEQQTLYFIIAALLASMCAGIFFIVREMVGDTE